MGISEGSAGCASSHLNKDIQHLGSMSHNTSPRRGRLRKESAASAAFTAIYLVTAQLWRPRRGWWSGALTSRRTATPSTAPRWASAVRPSHPTSTRQASGPCIPPADPASCHNPCRPCQGCCQSSVLQQQPARFTAQGCSVKVLKRSLQSLRAYKP